jgi:hypothetical protein
MVWLIFAVMPAHLAFAASTAQSGEPTDDDVAYLGEQCALFGWQKIALLIGAILVANFIIIWLISKLFAGDRGTLINAIQFCLVIVLIPAAIVGVGALLGDKAMLIALMLAVLAIPIGIYVSAMSVYGIRFTRVSGFMASIGIVCSILDTMVLVTVETPIKPFIKASDGERSTLVKAWKAKKLEARMTSPPQDATTAKATPALSEGQNLNEIYQKLQAERAQLNMKDPAAVAAFNQHVAEYNALKSQLSPRSSSTPVPSTPRPSKTTPDSRKEKQKVR